MTLGKFYSCSIRTSGTNEDLMTTFRAAVGSSGAILKKMSLVSSSSITVSVNGAPASVLYQDTDGLYKLSFDFGDILVSSLVVAENGVTVYLAAIY